MIPGTNYAAFYDTDSLERISGNPFIPCFAKEPLWQPFYPLLWQPFYPLFCKGPKSK